MTRADQLTESNRQAISDFVAAKCVKLPCGLCDKPDWQSCGFCGLRRVVLEADAIGEEITRSPLSDGVSAEGVLATVMCKGCGRVLFFSAKAVGVDVGR